MFIVDMSVLTALFYRPFRTFEQKPTNATARKFFLASIWYLGAGFLALTVHSSLEEDDWRLKMRRCLRGFCVHAALYDDIAVNDSCVWTGAKDRLPCPSTLVARTFGGGGAA
jgi:hypothetical protein